MKKVIEIENKIVTIFYEEKAKIREVPVIVLNTFDEDKEEIWNKAKELAQKEFILVAISNINWNKEMSPWYIKRLYNSEDDYSGDADKYLITLTTIIIPEVSKVINDLLNIEISYYSIAGYSLAGLFAIYSLYKTNLFKRVISCSGSMWYPKFTEYVKTNNLKIIPDKIYISLGNKESKTKNALMASVDKKTKDIKDYFENKGIQVIYEENEGNHFKNVTQRIAKGISWILKEE